MKWPAPGRAADAQLEKQDKRWKPIAITLFFALLIFFILGLPRNLDCWSEILGGDMIEELDCGGKDIKK